MVIANAEEGDNVGPVRSQQGIEQQNINIIVLAEAIVLTDFMTGIESQSWVCTSMENINIKASQM